MGTLDSGDAVMGDLASSDAAAGGGGGAPAGQHWDYIRGVTMETAQGMRSLQVCEQPPVLVWG